MMVTICTSAVSIFILWAYQVSAILHVIVAVWVFTPSDTANGEVVRNFITPNATMQFSMTRKTWWNISFGVRMQ